MALRGGDEAQGAVAALKVGYGGIAHVLGYAPTPHPDLVFQGFHPRLCKPYPAALNNSGSTSS